MRAWHGTRTGAFDRFKLPNRPKYSMQVGFGIHFAYEADHALLYAGRNGHLIEAEINPERIFDSRIWHAKGTAEHTFTAKMLKLTRYDRFLTGPAIEQDELWINPDWPTAGVMQTHLRAAGYDAIVYKTRHAVRGQEPLRFDAISLLDPDRIDIIARHDVRNGHCSGLDVLREEESEPMAFTP